jgi:hypothetical protein
MYFYQDRTRPDGTWSESKEEGKEDDKGAYAVEHRPGDCIEFSDDARIYPMHGVVKELPMVVLPRNATRGKPSFDGTTGWKKEIRIVVTIRAGDLDSAQKQAWKDMWEPAYTKSCLEAR